MAEEVKNRKPMGFAAMKLRNPELVREIARKGGASVAAENRSFSKDPALASKAGRKGGEASKGGGRKRGG